MLGAWKARARRRQRQLPLRGRPSCATCCADSRARAVVYHGRVRGHPRRGAARPTRRPRCCCRSTTPPAPTCCRAPCATRRRSPPPPRRSPEGLSPDDRYILYTGGTTGMPKGTLWRQGDFLATGARRLGLRGRDRRRRPCPCRAAHAALGAVHARRRPLERPVGVDVGRHGDRPGRPHPPRPRRRAGHVRAGAGQRPADRRRPVRPTAARRARAPRPRPVLPAVPALGRRRAVGPGQGRRWSPGCPACASSTCSARPRPVARRWPARRRRSAPEAATVVLSADRTRRLDARRRRDRLAGPVGPRAARLPRRRGQVAGDVPRRRRRPPRGGRRPGPAAGRRHHRAARPRLGHDQHRRREGVRRGGRAGPHLAPGRRRRRGGGPAERAVGIRDRGGAGVAPRRRPPHRRRPARPLPHDARRLQGAEGLLLGRPRASAPPPASPTTPGPVGSPSPRRQARRATTARPPSLSRRTRRSCSGRPAGPRATYASARPAFAARALTNSSGPAERLPHRRQERAPPARRPR